MASPEPSRKRAAPSSHIDALYNDGICNSSLLTPKTSSDEPHPKRRRLSPFSSSSSSSGLPKSSRSTPNGTYLTTPLSSARTIVPTMRLNLAIPENIPDQNERRILAGRVNAAKRWKPKLKRPFPKPAEIDSAYTLKLMRHYPGTVFTQAESNFIKPKIDTSPRVDGLLRRFPLFTTPITGQPTISQSPVILVQNTREVQRNKAITRSEEGQRLAWKCFSTPEVGRINRGREAMMESGLEFTDMANEEYGEPNQLPEWRKKYTGKFAKERVVIDLTQDD